MEGDTQVHAEAPVVVTALAVAAARAATDYRAIPIAELTARTSDYAGVSVAVTGRVLTVEVTFRGEEFILLDVPNPDDPGHAGEAAIEWPGPKDAFRPGQQWTFRGTVVGAHVSGGLNWGFTVSPHLRGERAAAA